MNTPLAEAVRAQAERSLSVEEAEAYLTTPITEDERREVHDLVRWFRRRYPAPVDRLRYIDRAYRRWRR